MTLELTIRAETPAELLEKLNDWVALTRSNMGVADLERIEADANKTDLDDEELTPEPRETAASGAETAPEELATDKAGLPWDERIHASSKALNADGTWRRKRGVSDETVAAVEAELKGNGAEDAPDAADPAPTADASGAPAAPTDEPSTEWVLYGPDGDKLGAYNDAEAFASAVIAHAATLDTSDEVTAFRDANLEAIREIPGSSYDFVERELKRDVEDRKAKEAKKAEADLIDDPADPAGADAEPVNVTIEDLRGLAKEVLNTHGAPVLRPVMEELCPGEAKPGVSALKEADYAAAYKRLNKALAEGK